MRVGVCDFPSAYEFPPRGYGGIERWLWSVAVGARRAGCEVHLLGPSWRDDLPAGFHRLPLRIENAGTDPGQWHEVRRRQLDLLVVGHEYPSQQAWRRAWLDLGCDVVSHQQDPNFRHADGAFDGRRSRLFCYSPEMLARYSRQHPRPALSTHLGFREEEPPRAVRGSDLVVWIGRIDAEKAPHLATMAAAALGLRIRIIGPVFDPEYVLRYREQFTAAHVELTGEVAGPSKLRAIAECRVLAYTCSRTYVEAAGAVFGESLRVGTPVAALAWRPGTSPEAALCGRTGRVAAASPRGTDEEAARSLAVAIDEASQLNASEVQEVGLRRFDPVAHFRVLAERS
jgi:glycosyltransferase involved in cell wall biosynthesis